MPTNPDVEEYLPLMRSQRNAVFGWVRAAGFDPASFDVTTAKWGETPCTRFAHRGSEYFFDVSLARGSFSARYSPGSSELLTHRMDVISFERLDGHVRAWLSYLRRELELPDLWALVREPGSAFAPFGAITDNGPFSSHELAQVVIAIDTGRTYLANAGVAGEELAEANRKLDYLVEAAKHSGRMDWFNIAFSVLFQIGLQVAFDLEGARSFIETVFTAVGQLRLP